MGRTGFGYLGSCISSRGRTSDEVSSRIQETRVIFANLRHPCHRRDILLSTKGRINTAAARSVLLYCPET